MRLWIALGAVALATMIATAASAGFARGGHAIAPRTTKAPPLPKQERGQVGYRSVGVIAAASAADVTRAG